MRGKRCTFHDLFMDYLETCIKLGGDDVEGIVNLVNAYQEGYPSIRQSEFVEWLENESFLCEKCDHEFKADRETSEGNQVLCPPCAASERGYDEARGRRR